ncbi:hypothetical protein JCM10296v2_000066 [Rhodotorula toruloides]
MRAVNRLVLSKALAERTITESQHKYLVRYASAGAVPSRSSRRSSKMRDVIKKELIKQGARPEWAEEQAKAATHSSSLRSLPFLPTLLRLTVI